MRKTVFEVIREFIGQKHKEKILIKNGFTHCGYCKRTIFKFDRYCQYCGKPMGTKIS